MFRHLNEPPTALGLIVHGQPISTYINIYQKSMLWIGKLGRSVDLELLGRFDSIFDVLRPTGKGGHIPDSEVEALVAERTAAKKARNFAAADRIREQLLGRGIVLEDTKSGVRWKRK